MSQENGEIVRRVDDGFLAGLERGDFAGGIATGLVSEDHELIVVAEFPGRRSYRVRDGLVEFVQRWTEDFEQSSIQRQELIDGGNGRVFSGHKQSAIGKGSGVPIEVEHFSVFELELGLWFEPCTISTATKPSKPPDSRRKRSEVATRQAAHSSLDDLTGVPPSEAFGAGSPRSSAEEAPHLGRNARSVAGIAGPEHVRAGRVPRRGG